MQHPFLQLQPEYAADMAHLSITRPHDVDIAAKRVLANITRYKAAVAGTTIPAAFIGALDLRESNCNPNLGLGQGDPWNQVSRHVPAGFGPFPSWSAAARFYIHYDHLDNNTQPWSIEYECWKGEAWNGFGPRAHGKATGYLWSGTNIYTGGKYVADGVWDPNTSDIQLGIIPVILRLGQLDASLALGSSLPDMDVTVVVPIPQAPPLGIGNTNWVQSSLNALGATPQLVVNGNFGRNTRFAVYNYQKTHGLQVDGLVGPATIASIETQLKAK